MGIETGASQSSRNSAPANWYDLFDVAYVQHDNRDVSPYDRYKQDMILGIEYVLAKQFIFKDENYSAVESSGAKSLKNIYDIGSGLNEFTTARFLCWWNSC